ncbi:hypothetical protein LU11_gp293 [Pseudomonas phage Lu11]|uniref:hypothetical protein n=1 Tax=Pseudomonas phage Lu11 TaxID=1161927 RepID=UPI00025F184F|nr:hypothetical protein LU11_gp293 [Pseudomonas phage Lu11]AFH14824.1 hypothetical protein Lu11_0286 [Pseudomonas phage Lu11]
MNNSTAYKIELLNSIGDSACAIFNGMGRSYHHDFNTDNSLFLMEVEGERVVAESLDEMLEVSVMLVERHIKKAIETAPATGAVSLIKSNDTAMPLIKTYFVLPENAAETPRDSVLLKLSKDTFRMAVSKMRKNIQYAFAYVEGQQTIAENRNRD